MAPPRKHPEPSVERLRELMSYDPETGVLRWRARRGHRAVPGAVVGRKCPTLGYIMTAVDSVRVMGHRAAWMISNGDIPPGVEVDHVNGDRADNRLENLRLVRRDGNSQNRRSANKNNRTGFLGVRARRGKFYSELWYTCPDTGKPKRACTGPHDTGEEAHLGYLGNKRKYHPACTI
jgi:hypothetical protein